MGKKSKSSVSTKRRSRTSHIGLGEKVTLERILGLTSQNDSSLACCPCGTGCVAYSAGCVIVIFNPKKNKQEYLFNASRKTITALAFSQDGKYLVSGECGHNPAVRVWDVKEKTEVCSFTGHKYGINCVAFLPVRGYIVSVGEQHDMVINVWDWKSDSGRVSSGKIATMVTDIAFHEDGNTFVTVGNRSVKFWYFSGKSKTRQTLPLHGRNSILGEQKNHMFCSVTFGREGNSNRVYAITKSGLLCEFNEDRMLDKWVELRTRQAFCITASDDHLFVGCADGVMRIFSASTLHFVTSLPKPHHLKIDVAAGIDKDHIFSPKENASYPDTVATVVDIINMKLTCIYSDHSLYVWDVHDVHKIGKQWSFLYHSSCIWGIDVYPELSEGNKAMLPPNTFSTCSSDNTIRIWNIDPAMDTTIFSKNIYCPELLKVLYSEDGGIEQDNNGIEQKDGIRCLCFSPDGQMLASGDRSGNIKVYDLLYSKMNELHKVEAHDAEILCLEFSNPDTGHKLLASASRDRFIHIFDMNKNCSLLQTLDDHSSSITSVKFSESNGRFQMISCGADKALLLRVATLTPDLQFSLLHHVGSKTTLYDMAIDVSKKYVATACQDRNLRIHNICSGKLKQTYKGSQSEDGTLIKVTLDPSGMYAATSCSDKTLAIYDFYSGLCMATMMGHSELVTGLKFTNDCRQLVSVSGDGCIFVWKLPFEMTNNMKERINERKQRLKVAAQINQARRETFIVPSVPDVVQLDSENPEDNKTVLPDFQDDDDGPPEYRFSIGISKMPLWAQRKVSGDVLPNSDNFPKPAQPRGKWAQNMSSAGFLMMADETTIPVKPLDYQDKRRYSLEPEGLDDEDDDDFFVPAEQMFNNGEDQAGTDTPPASPKDKVRRTRGSDAMTRSREPSLVDSVDGDEEGDDETDGGTEGPAEGDRGGTDVKEDEDDDVQEEIIIYPEEDPTTTECLEFQVTESTLSFEELERKKHKRANSREMLLSKGAEDITQEGGVASAEVSDDDDDEDDDDDITPDVTPLSSPVRQPTSDLTSPDEEDEMFLHENFTFQEKERFDQCLEQLTNQDREKGVFDRRMSISGKFMQRSRSQDPLLGRKQNPNEILGELLRKRQEDTRKAVEAMRKRLESSSITSIKEAKTPPMTPKEEARPFTPPADTTPSNHSREGDQMDQSETVNNPDVNRTTDKSMPLTGASDDDRTKCGQTVTVTNIIDLSKKDPVLAKCGGESTKAEQSTIHRPNDLKLPQIINKPGDQGSSDKGDASIQSRVNDIYSKGTSDQRDQNTKETTSATTKTNTEETGSKGANNTKSKASKDDLPTKDGKPLRGRSIVSPLKRSSSLSRISQQGTTTEGDPSQPNNRRSLSSDRQTNKNNAPNTAARQKHRAKPERTSSPLLRSYEVGTESTLAKIKRKVGPGAKRSRRSLPPSGPMRATEAAIKPADGTGKQAAADRDKPPAKGSKPVGETSKRDLSAGQERITSNSQNGTADPGKLDSEADKSSGMAKSSREDKMVSVDTTKLPDERTRPSDGIDRTCGDVNLSGDIDQTSDEVKSSTAGSSIADREKRQSVSEMRPLGDTDRSRTNEGMSSANVLAADERSQQIPKMNGDMVQSPTMVDGIHNSEGTAKLGAAENIPDKVNGASSLLLVLNDSIKQVNKMWADCFTTLAEIQKSGEVTDFNRGLESLSTNYASMGTPLESLKKSQAESALHGGATPANQEEMLSCLSQYLHPEGTNGTRKDGDMTALAAMNRLLDKYSSILVTIYREKLESVNTPQEEMDGDESDDDRDVIDC